MKKTLFSLFALILCASLSAQQSAKSGSIDSFHSVSLTGGVIVKLIRVDVNSVDAGITDADINNLKWSVTNGVLSVTFRQPSAKAGKAEVTIKYAGPLKSVSIANGQLSFDNPLTGDMLNISVKGGGVLTGSVDVLDLVLDVTGNSVASLSGEAKYVSLHAAEKSKVDIRAVEAVSVEADAGLGSEAFVYATERLVANAKTGATIFYKGSPVVVRDLSSKLNTTIGSSVQNIGK